MVSQGRGSSRLEGSGSFLRHQSWTFHCAVSSNCYPIPFILLHLLVPLDPVCFPPYSNLFPPLISPHIDRWVTVIRTWHIISSHIISSLLRSISIHYRYMIQVFLDDMISIYRHLSQLCMYLCLCVHLCTSKGICVYVCVCIGLACLMGIYGWDRMDMH